ncbi:transcription factor mef2A-like [Saccostrea cucullata]|uniref:transcription factor mef2A-like n=1 Tax=Saccostrea cuccullata TaxID=36930 RepID=UPI002ED578FE
MKNYFFALLICGIMFLEEITAQTTRQGQNSKSGSPGNETISKNLSNGRNENVQNNLNSPQQNADFNQRRNTYNRLQNQNRQPINPGNQNWNNGGSGKNWNNGPSIWTAGNSQNRPSGTQGNNVPPSNNNWNNGQQTNNNRHFNGNWKNGPPNGNLNGGPQNGNWNGRPPNDNWNGGSPNGNWNGGPPNGNWNGGPPFGNSNGGPPNGNWNGGPPNGNWNNGPPNGNQNIGPPNGNWNNGPPNDNQNIGPPNSNWNGGPPNGNWNNGPPNTNNGHPNGNWNNGPPNGSPYGPWSQGPPFPGPGYMLDPDLPDGLDTMYQRMQAMQAMHAVNQYAGNLGAFDVIPPMAFPHPIQVPPMDPRPPGVGTDPKTGFPMRPHTRAGVWNGITSPSENSTANITMAFSRRNSAVLKTIQPKLAEFLHQGQIVSGNETNNSSGINGTYLQSKTMSSSQNYPYNPYSYGFNAFGFNPWAQSYQPDIPDHLENKNDRAKAIENKPPYNPPPYNQAGWSQRPRERITGLAQTNQTGQPATSEIMSQGIRNVQKIQSQMPSMGWQASSPQQQSARTNQAWPSQQQRYQPRTPSSVQRSSNVQGTKKPDPDGGKQGGDVEKEVDKDKEESQTKTNIDVIKSVLDEVYRQRNNKDLSVSSIMDAINNRKTKIKMQYRYEGNVPPPSWTRQLENIEPKNREPVPTPKPAELIEEEVNKTSIPRTGASFRFSSKYIPQNFATLMKNPRLTPISNFPSRTEPPQNTPNYRWTQSPPNPSKLPSSPTTNKDQTKDIIQQAIGIVQQSQSNNKTISDLANILGDSLKTTTEKVATLNVDTEITIQKGDKVHVINHEQVITVPINSTTPSPPSQNQMGVTMAVMEMMPELTTPQEMVEKVPIPAESALSPSSTFGIIVGTIIGLTVILGPIICILCRVRRRHGEKKRKLSAKQSGYRKGDAEAMETMINCDFGDPLPSSSFGIGAGAKAKVKSFLTKTVSPGKSCTELQAMKPKSQTTTAMIH